MNFNEVKQQVTTIDRDQMASIKGGNGDSTSIIIVDVDVI